MQLTSLEIKGFKSFGDKITIHFNEGITAIVGPNGCGKSNVVDAIRWVLGEQRTRILRSEAMENIIFNGSKNRKASHLAEVSLSFKNTKNILPTEFSHVTITRKLFRNGDSEYRLNEVICRLKDIKDLFLDTGIGSDSYAIIELKMIDEIINNKDHSRRALFEEASGIAKYKIRKKQTEAKLSETESDLSRVDDLLFELEKNIKTLENQAKKAAKFLKLKEQYKSLSIAIAYVKIHQHQTDIAALENRENAYQDAIIQFNTQLNQLENSIQQQKLKHTHQEKNLSIQQKATNECLFKIKNYENDKKIKNEQFRFLQEKEAKLKEEIDKDKAQQNHIHYQLKRLQEELILENQKMEQLKSQLESLKMTLEEMRLQLQNEKIQVDSLQKKANETQNLSYKIDKEIEVLNIQKQTLSQESERAFDETENKTLELSAFETAMLALQESIHSKTEENEILWEFENEISAELESKSQLLQQHKDKCISINRSIDAKQNEYNLTKSLIDNLEGFPESIRFLKKNTTWAKNAPLLSDLLFCDEQYRIAIENYLEPYMNYYVVDTSKEALEGIALLSDSAKGRANFFVLEAFKSVKTPKEIPKESIAALNIVEFHEKYKHLCHHLLQDVCIISKQEDAFFQKNQLEEDWVYLSKSGKYSSNSLSYAGGSIGLFEGKRIGRAKNIELLQKEIKKLQLEFEKLDAENIALAQRINYLKKASQKAKIEFLRQEIHRLQTELISLQTKHEQYQNFIQNSQHRKTAIEEKITQIDAQLAESNPKLIAINSALMALKNESHERLENYQELAHLVNDENIKFNDQNIKFHQQENKVNSIAKDIEYREVQLENIENRLTNNEKSFSEVQSQKIQTALFTDTEDETLIALYQEKSQMELALNEIENAYYKIKDTINQEENKLELLRKDREDAQINLQNIKDQKNEIKLQFNGLKERLAVEFQLEIETILEYKTQEIIEESALESKLAQLKTQISAFGNINPLAMESYQESQERHTFILGQKNDLLDAKKDLLTTIKEIDDTASQKFMEAFNHVRSNFINVFRSLFNEEDSCDLVLTLANNPLESDIDIIAKPKGKRPLSINQLSGGEKTLTATALLFSLYLLKPAPFCIFDEVDAPLDDTNIDKFNKIIRKFSNESQFIVVSHNKKTIASTDIIYGVTMVEPGVSRVVAVDLRNFVE